MALSSNVKVAVAVALLAAALLSAQSAADATAPAEGVADTGRLLGRTGFAYVTGLRTFAAAVLWNRLDPQLHEYYEGRPLVEQVQILPTIRLVQALDPQFLQSYYVAAWIVARQGDVPGGLRIAREGVESNPASGLLRANYAQMLLMLGGDPEAARRQADIALRGPTSWTTEEERFEGYAVFAEVYGRTGEADKERALRAQLQYMRDTLPVEVIGQDHDHDGDGVQDH